VQQVAWIGELRFIDNQNAVLDVDAGQDGASGDLPGTNGQTDLV